MLAFQREGGPVELADDRAVLLAGRDVHRHDAALAVAGLPFVRHGRLRADRVAVEDGVGVLDLVVGEVRDDGPVGGLGDGHPRRQRHRVQPVDHALAELGVGGVLGVEMEGLLVHRHVTEPLVVALADCAGAGVLDGLADLEFPVVASRHARRLVESGEKARGRFRGMFILMLPLPGLRRTARKPPLARLLRLAAVSAHGQRDGFTAPTSRRGAPRTARSHGSRDLRSPATRLPVVGCGPYVVSHAEREVGRADLVTPWRRSRHASGPFQSHPA